MRILYFGDIVGRCGLEFLKQKLSELRVTYKPNLIFVNGENIDKGKGLSLEEYKELMGMNIAAISMGNHTFRNKEINTFIDEAKIARPLNINKVNGKGYVDILYNDKKVTLVNLLGTSCMHTDLELINPFTAIEDFLNIHKADYYIVDMHAEVTSEKITMGYFLDGKVDAVLGTHTHVQTNDARILPKGTLYLTDLGMVGPMDGVLGVSKEIMIDRFAYGGTQVFKLEENGKMQINGVFLELDNKKQIKIIHLEN